MLKRWLRRILGIDNELRGQKLLNAQLLKQNHDLSERIVSMAVRLTEVEHILGIQIGM